MGEVSRGGVTDENATREPEEARVLHVDDDEAFLEMSQRFLSDDHDISVTTMTDPEAALGRLEEFECVISDYDMLPMDGIAFLEQVRERDADLPFVLFTGKGSEEVAAEAISAGVTDYLQKGPSTDRFTVLANRILNAIKRQRAENRAEEKDREIRRVYERITDAFVALDHEWEYTYVNRQAAELLERDAKSLLGETIWESFPETLDSPFETELRRAFNDQEQVTFEAFYAPLDVWLEVRAFPSESGLSIYFRNISERKETERRYNAIFNNTYQFTGLMEPDGTLIEANETALAFGGVDREDVVGEPIWETHWFQESEETRQAARRAVERASEGAFVREEVAVNGDGRTAIIDFSVKPVYDDAGEVTLLIPEGRDITELKERERQLEQQNEQLEKFASIVSHDLKTPLTVANGTLELAMETGDTERLDEASSALERMDSLIDELLELAKHGDIVENPEPIALRPLLSDVRTDVIGASSATVGIEFDDGATIVAEKSRLYSLLSNLLDNAIEHSGEDPTIEVGLDGNTLYVADNGPGIPESKRGSVFDPGYSGTDGTGFGLTIVEAIVDAHGWDISVTESRWGGACFEISGLDVRSGG